MIQPLQNCNDCKVTFNKQRELLMKQDKQIQQNYHTQKESREHIKVLNTKLQSTEINLEELKKELKNSQDLLLDITKRSENPDVTQVDQNCKQCKFKCKDSKNMDSHVFNVHTLQRCHICSEAFTNMAALKNHVMKHLNNELEYSCGVCNKLYKTIEEAKDHAMKVCGIIQEKRGQSEQKKE
jgi:hypothetical protein